MYINQMGGGQYIFTQFQDNLECKATSHNHEVAMKVEISFDTAARTSRKTSKGSRRRCNHTYETSDIYVRHLAFVCLFSSLVLRFRKKHLYIIRVHRVSSCDLIFVDKRSEKKEICGFFTGSPQEISKKRAPCPARLIDLTTEFSEAKLCVSDPWPERMQIINYAKC